MKRNGFTLVELLVVIAILVILAAILFPVFRAARASAYSVKCVANLKQIGTAVRLYLDDYDQTYPQGAYDTNGDPTKWNWSWHNSLAYYVQSYEPFVCPVAPANATYRTSYGCNRFLSGFNVGVRESLVPIPGNVLYLTEKCNEDWPFFVPGETQFQYWQALDPRHRGRIQALFCDGHVGAVRPEELRVVQVNQEQ